MTEPRDSESDGPSTFLSGISPPVFFGSAILIVAFVVLGIVSPAFTSQVFGAVQAWIIATFGWFYMLAVAIFLVFTLGLAVSRYGGVRLGPDDSEPDFSTPSWFAMLFSAGMGIGLMFFGVAEPMLHFSNPPVGTAGTVDTAREAMRITFFHWGAHAWAIYAVVGLSLAYFGFRHNLPLTIRSSLYPLIGSRIDGPIGHAADVFAVLGTMFGVATSLGLGVLQVNSGLNYLFDVPDTMAVKLGLIAGITAVATISVVSGLDAGIRRISELNLLLAVLLLLFVLVVGPTQFLFQALVQNVGAYLSGIVEQTFNLYAYQPNAWIGGWTLFYWGWWISWAPFVGMFIARVSRGRTIREFVVGVLFAPVGFTAVWMTSFGNTAIALDQGPAAGAITAAVQENVSTALFRFFEFLPLGTVASLVATVLVITFFVTSSDSGSLVIDIITSGGRTDPPVWQRVFWAVVEGLVAAALLLAGGLSGLQTAAITAALPFTFMMLFVCYGLLRGLRMEGLRRVLLDKPAMLNLHGQRLPWQQRLRTLLNHPRKEAAQKFLGETAEPALQDVARELEQGGLEVQVEREDGAVSLTVMHGEEREFMYAVRLRSYQVPSYAFPGMDLREDRHRRYSRAEVHLLEGAQHYDLLGFTREQVISDVLAQYEKHMHFLHVAR